MSQTNAHAVCDIGPCTSKDVERFRNGRITSNLSKGQTSSHEMPNTNEPRMVNYKITDKPCY